MADGINYSVITAENGTKMMGDLCRLLADGGIQVIAAITVTEKDGNQRVLPFMMAANDHAVMDMVNAEFKLWSDVAHQPQQPVTSPDDPKDPSETK